MWVTNLWKDAWRYLVLLCIALSPVGVGVFFGLLYIHNIAQPNAVNLELQQRVLGADDQESLRAVIEEIDEELRELSQRYECASSSRQEQLDRERENDLALRRLAVKKLHKLERQLAEDNGT